MFSLGLTAYEAASSAEMEELKHGCPAYQGWLPYNGSWSKELHALIEDMIHPDVSQRLTALSLIHHPYLNAAGKKMRHLKELLAEQDALKQSLLTQLDQLNSKGTQVHTSSANVFGAAGWVRSGAQKFKAPVGMPEREKTSSVHF